MKTAEDFLKENYDGFFDEFTAVELSDIRDALNDFAKLREKHYAKEVVNSITDKEIDGTFSTDHYYTNKGAKWFKQQLLKRIEYDG